MRPNYDIDRFAYHVPTTITTLDLGHELSIEKEELPVATPLFENKIWLWIILIVITLSLGWFSIKMMKNNHDVQE